MTDPSYLRFIVTIRLVDHLYLLGIIIEPVRDIVDVQFIVL